jgi:hypothetical protein
MRAIFGLFLGPFFGAKSFDINRYFVKFLFWRFLKRKKTIYEKMARLVGSSKANQMHVELHGFF